jgi:hypothetical protein
MRPERLRLGLLVVSCGALTLSLSACVSTEQESERIAREGTQPSAAAGSLRLGAANRSVRVSDVTLLAGGGRAAVAARLTATSSQAQRDLPVLVRIFGRGGKVLYSNDAGGLEASLQHIALLRPNQGAWWVDDQVLSTQPASRVEVRVGTGASSSPRGPAVTTAAVSSTQQSGVGVVSGRLVNHSNQTLGNVAVFAVALHAGRVVAAGRAVVAALPGHAGASVPFQLFLVGSSAAARIELSTVAAAR